LVFRVLKKDLPTPRQLAKELLANPEELKEFLENRIQKTRKKFWEREIKKFNMKKKKSN